MKKEGRSMEWFKKGNKKYILGIFAIAILLFLPMFLNPYYENGDTLYHVANLSSMVQVIQNNFFDGIFEKILPFIGNNFGYGTRLFYPPLAHTVTAYMAYFLDFFSIDMLDTMKIMHFLVFLFSGIIMFYCSNRFFKDSKLSFIASLIYMTSAYHLNEIYVRDAEAESMIFLFLPLILTSIKELLEGNKKLFYPLFIIGYVGGILSHFTLMIYFTIFLGISMLFFHKKIFKKEFLVPFLKACGLVLLLTLFFFEPLLEHKFLGNYRVYEKWVMSWGIQHTALWGFEYFAPFAKDDIYFFFSIVTIIMLVAVARYQRKTLKQEKYKLVLIFGLLSLWLSTVYFPWIIMPYTFFMIQFGWRLVAFVILAVSFLAPLAIKNVKSKVLYSLIVIGLVLSGFASIHFASTTPVDLSNIEYVYGMGWQREYLPVNTETNKEYFDTRDDSIHFMEGNGSAIIIEDEVPYLKFQLDTVGFSSVELPRLFYFGYVLKDQDGKKYPVFENGNGFVQANLPSGTYTMDFEGSLVYKICFCISMTTFVLVFLYIFGKIIFKLSKKRIKRK